MDIANYKVEFTYHYMSILPSTYPSLIDIFDLCVIYNELVENRGIWAYRGSLITILADDDHINSVTLFLRHHSLPEILKKINELRFNITPV